MELKSCYVCGKETKKYGKCLKANKHFYCSRTCMGKSMIRAETKKCIICGKEYKFYRNSKRKSKNTFCSIDCKSKYFKGKHISVSSEFKQGSIGKKSPAYKSGIKYNNYGYRSILVEAYRYVQEHRLVMEKHLGRNLLNTEVVHHIDGNKLNNNIENLMLFESNSKHQKYHQQCKKLQKIQI